MRVLAVRIQTCSNLFITLTWMSALLYFMMGHLLDENSKNGVQRLRQDLPGGKQGSLMYELGFVGEPKLFPQSYHDTSDISAVVTAVGQHQLPQLAQFVNSLREYFPQRKLIVYDLGLSPEEKLNVTRVCRCLVRTVMWERYPNHVTNLNRQAYKPFLIQECLQELGSVFWCDVHIRFNSSYDHSAILLAQSYGLAAWPRGPYPTSSLTHYNTFRYFRTSQNKYYFHRMADPSIAIYYNTELVHKQIMLPWIKCALDYNCLWPLGAQPSGCNFNRRPKYIYAGCHGYDASIFNVILGLAFRFESPYITPDVIFSGAASDSSDDSLEVNTIIKNLFS